MLCFAVGLTSIVAGAVLPTLTLFILGGVVAGSGAGIMFRSAIGAASGMADADRRGETLALLFLIAYGGLVVPVLLVGLSLTFAAETSVLLVFAVVVLAATLGAGLAMRRHLAHAGPRPGEQAR